MAQLVRTVIDGYNDIMENKSDPRVKGWLLMSSPFPTIGISICYAIFVMKIGPKLMENRKPYELKNILVIYNALQVIISTYLFYEAGITGWLTTYSYRCQPVDYSMNPLAIRMVHGCWWYYMSKFSEFFDTFFFVLRKKFNHISTLHVIHHGIMPVSVWWGVKFFAGGQSTFFGFLNTFVHIIMYSYYMFAAMGPQFQKYLWWKKYLTVLQMIQFVLVALHSGQIFFIECDYPKSFMWFIGAHAILFYFLFSSFYRTTYTPKKKKEAMKTRDNKKVTPGICFPKQTALYETSDKSSSISNGYTTESSDKLRNRAFIDKGVSNSYKKL